MANLATIEVNTNGEYLDLAELADVTFTTDNVYCLQIQSNKAYLREGDIGDGILVPSIKPIQYTAKADTLYIKTDYAIVNIAG